MIRDVFSKRFKAHVISLERTPQRLKQFWDWNRPAEIDIEVFKAVDGRTLDFATVDPEILKPGTTSYKIGSVGSAMSHRTLWQECAAGDKPYLIFEDDAAIRGDLRSTLPRLVDQIPADWDLLCLGYNTDTIMDIDVGANIRLRFGFPGRNIAPSQLTRFTPTRGPVGVARLLNFFGLCAYLISPQGARNLLKHCFPLDGRLIFIPGLNRNIVAFTLDSRINAHLAALQAYACIPPLVLPSNDAATSAKT